MGYRYRYQQINDTDHGAVKAFLAAAGMNPGQLQAALGTRPSGRTYDMIAQSVVAWLQKAPKGP